ncbi:MAG: 2-C-methyl-D-erythritol 4-phosphate cytidylyltransferase [Cytophagales bacterium]|nr:2-C-methyl-D-erythritol 4-phosphate cytidylyltransferase [Cytophagales bacterium]
MTRYVIVVAGGKGLRMGSKLPKQFLDLCGKPILIRTLEAFHLHDPTIKIILVLPESHQAYWKQVTKEHSFNIPIQLVNGGKERFHSVKNGLDAIHEKGLVAVHDAVRPLIDPEIIENTFQSADQNGAAIAVVKLKESIRMLDGDQSKAVPRESYRMVQTPQVFKTELLKQAYKQPFQDDFTDDASVVENIGQQVVLVEGSYKNIKITTPEDLELAKTYFDEFAS